MAIVVSLALISGMVLGLRFNVRVVFALCLVVMVGGIITAISGLQDSGEATLVAVSVTVALQVGYFVSMVIGAMNLTESPEERRATGERRERIEAPRT